MIKVTVLCSLCRLDGYRSLLVSYFVKNSTTTNNLTKKNGG